MQRDRSAILAAFADRIFGHAPPPVAPPAVRTALAARPLPNGAGTYEELAVTVWPDAPELRVLVVRPAQPRPAPAVIGLNFCGNQALLRDPELTLSRARMLPQLPGVVDGRATDLSRGTAAGTWCALSLAAEGIALVTACYGDLEPDDASDPSGLSRRRQAAGQGDGGSIAAWAWILRRLADVAGADPGIDPTRLAAVGFSRLGKTALWAAAQDERFAAAILCQSGLGGASPWRDLSPGAETVPHMVAAFPYWLHPRLAVDLLPCDSDALLACVAPRRLLVTNASESAGAPTAFRL